MSSFSDSHSQLRLPETLEPRFLLTGPTVASVTANTPVVEPGQAIQLQAILETNDGADAVQFFLDDGDVQFDSNADQLLATDETNNGWQATVQTSGPYKILPLGDSITAARSPQQSYRYPLWQHLTEAGYEFDFVGTATGPDSLSPQVDDDHEGHWGWRADEVLAQLPNWLEHSNPDIVLMHLGTNDLFQNQSNASTLNDLENIVATLRANNPAVIILASLLIPSNFPSNALIESFNAELAVRTTSWSTDRSPVVLVDQNTSMNPATHLYDGVHPNAAGEQIMADVWFEHIMQTLPLPNPTSRFSPGTHTIFAAARDSAGAFGVARSTTVTSSTPGSFNGTALVGLNSGNEFWMARSNGATLETGYAGAWPRSLNFSHTASGDINGDGLDDIVGRATNGEIRVALADGNGGFQFGNWGYLSYFTRWLEFYVADFSGDGQADLAARDATNGAWWVGTSNGNSFTFSRWSTYPPSIGWEFVVGDFNGDSQTDIAGRADTDGSWWTAVSRGSYFQNRYWGRWGTAVNWSDILVGDFNGDGRDDVAGRANNTYWWVGTSNGSSFQSSYWGSWTASVVWHDVTVGDFNGDGRDDIAGRGNGQWWIASPRSDAPYFRNQFWGYWTTSTTWSDVRVIDINRDGKQDLIGRAANGDWWSFIATTNRFYGVKATRWSAGSTWQYVTGGRFV